MKGTIVIVASALMLAGCASWTPTDFIPSAPAGGGGSAGLRLESEPPGADARTSAGQSCRTPCALTLPANDLTVTFTLPNFVPQTIPVRIRPPGDPRTEPGNARPRFDPDPVFAALEPAPPPPRKKRPAKKAPPAANTSGGTQGKGGQQRSAPPPKDEPPPGNNLPPGSPWPPPAR